MWICVGEGARETVGVQGGNLGKNQVRSEAVGVQPTVRVMHGGWAGAEDGRRCDGRKDEDGEDQWDEDGMREGVMSSVRGVGAVGLDFSRPSGVCRSRELGGSCRDAPAETGGRSRSLCTRLSRFSTGPQVDAHSRPPSHDPAWWL